jgi:hypothetical protein
VSARPRRSTTRAPARRRPATGRDFWGIDDSAEDSVEVIRPIDDPAAVIKSLGTPPVQGFETAAEQYFAAICDKAVALAVALAAANGLLAVTNEDAD